jgi:hypothetical protein
MSESIALVFAVFMILVGLDYCHIVTWSQWIGLISEIFQWLVVSIG